MRHLSICCCAVVAGCTNSVTIPAFTDGYPGTPSSIEQSVVVTVPSGWTKWNNDWGPLKRTGQLNLVPGPLVPGDEGPIIRVIFGRLDPTSPPTPEGQIAGYLEAMHDKEDSTVVRENYQSLCHPVYGEIKVWHLHSAYSGHRLLSKYVNRNASLSIELICDSRAELSEYQEAFSSMATSFGIIDKANKTSLLTPDPPPVPAPMTATTSTHSRSLAPGQA